MIAELVQNARLRCSRCNLGNNVFEVLQFVRKTRCSKVLPVRTDNAEIENVPVENYSRRSFLLY